TAQDYKRALDGDKGPNTGGMGAVSPAPALDANPHLTDQAWREVVENVIHGMKAEGMPYQGFLYVGLMITDDGPKVIEFNCRFGDPEAEVILPRLESDLLSAIVAATKSQLHQTALQFKPGAAVTVVMANGGYPGPISPGGVITGLAEDEITNSMVFHAGTQMTEGKIIAAGGRVLAVTGWGKDQASARQTAYARVKKINWPDVYYRKDIAR
ncbi:MAG: phosphoribosylamine--glycine ligase, partial [Proteobacteria bacterium]|nr:phosphoribosylamine--glycine ligase [Pseudomonadota bacterium]